MKIPVFGDKIKKTVAFLLFLCYNVYRTVI